MWMKANATIASAAHRCWLRKVRPKLTAYCKSLMLVRAEPGVNLGAPEFDRGGRFIRGAGLLQQAVLALALLDLAFKLADQLPRRTGVRAPGRP
jgi:hypothetical protein